MLEILYPYAVKLGAIVLSVASIFTPSAKLGQASPSVPALIDDYLATAITNTATSMTLAGGTYRDGTPISGYTCFTVDVNTPTIEYICGTASGTAVTGLVRGLSYSNPNATSSALAYKHNRLASVTITDYPNSQFNTRKINGVDPLPSSSPLFYDSTSTSQFTDNRMIPSLAWVNAQIYGTSTYWLALGNDIYNGNSGKVGIGTMYPSSTLHIIGDSRVSGNSYIGGTLNATGTATFNATQISGALNVSGSAVFSATTTISASSSYTNNASSSFTATTSFSNAVALTTSTPVSSFNFVPLGYLNARLPSTVTSTPSTATSSVSGNSSSTSATTTITIPASSTLAFHLWDCAITGRSGGSASIQLSGIDVWSGAMNENSNVTTVTGQTTASFTTTATGTLNFKVKAIGGSNTGEAASINCTPRAILFY